MPENNVRPLNWPIVPVQCQPECPGHSEAGVHRGYLQAKAYRFPDFLTLERTP